MLAQIILSIIIFFILLLMYGHINKKTSVIFTFSNHIFKLIKLKSSNLYLEYLMTHIKNPSIYKYALSLFLVTLIIAYVLYNNIFFVVVLSGSMRPTADKGDMILMQNFNVTPEVGDIIMFHVEKIGKDDVITHRVHSISESGIRTKGDAGSVDNWIIHENNIISEAIIVGDKPIVMKDVGFYFLDESPTSTYRGEFGFIQTVLLKSKEFGLLIFVVCVVLFILLSVNDAIKQKKLRNRRFN